MPKKNMYARRHYERAAEIIGTLDVTAKVRRALTSAWMNEFAADYAEFKPALFMAAVDKAVLAEQQRRAAAALTPHDKWAARERLVEQGA